MTYNSLQFYFLLLLLGVSSILVTFIFLPFLTAIVLALIFAVVLRPLNKEIHAQMPELPGIASLLTMGVGTVGILLPLIILGTLLVNQAEGLYITLTQNSSAYIQAPFNNLDQTIKTYLPETRLFENISFDLEVYLKHGLEWIISNGGIAFSKVISLLISSVVFFFVLYYLLRDGSTLKRAIVRLSPLNDVQDEIILNRMMLAINSVIKGNLVIALIQGVLTAIGFTLFGISNGILWGMVASIGALIPGVGTTLVFAPAVFFLFFTGNLFSASGLLIWGLFAVGLIDNFLGPKLIGENMHMHPLFILIAVLGGLAVFGPVGIFLGPLAISLFFALLSIYSDMAKST